MFLMIDNQDSFAYNLVAYFRELGVEIEVRKNNEVTLKDCLCWPELQGIILSPGPGKPVDAGNSVDIFAEMRGKVPILGVCLGHQLIGQYYGFKLAKGKRPMHGKISILIHHGKGLFQNIPSEYLVTRYHSLILQEEWEKNGLQIDARTDDEVIMAVSDSNNGVYGVQFHPESIQTMYGHELLSNFISICDQWRIDHE